MGNCCGSDNDNDGVSPERHQVKGNANNNNNQNVFLTTQEKLDLLLEDTLRKFQSVRLEADKATQLHFPIDERWRAHFAMSGFDLHPTPARALLGKGGFSSAYRVKRCTSSNHSNHQHHPQQALGDDDSIAVCKVIQKTRISNTARQIMHLCAELAITGYVHHPNLNRRIALFDSDEHIFIILEMCSGWCDYASRVAAIYCNRAAPELMTDILKSVRQAQTEFENDSGASAPDVPGFVKEIIANFGDKQQQQQSQQNQQYLTAQNSNPTTSASAANANAANDMLTTLSEVFTRAHDVLDPTDDEIGDRLTRSGFFHRLGLQFGLENDRLRKYSSTNSQLVTGEIPFSADLFHYVVSYRLHNCLVPEPVVAVILRQVVRGVDALHQHSIVHRDLKSENVVVAVQRRATCFIDPKTREVERVEIVEQFQIKIIDFGLAKLMMLPQAGQAGGGGARAGSVVGDKFGETLTPSGVISATEEASTLAAKKRKERRRRRLQRKLREQQQQQQQTQQQQAPAIQVEDVSGGEDEGEDDEEEQAVAVDPFAEQGVDDRVEIPVRSVAEAAAASKTTTGATAPTADPSGFYAQHATSSNRNIFGASPEISVAFPVSTTPGQFTYAYAPFEAIAAATKTGGGGGGDKLWKTTNLTLAKCDVYGIGCIAYLLSQGRPPFSVPHDVQDYTERLHEIQRQIAAGPPKFRDGSISTSLRDLILGMMSKEPTMRPTTESILEHPLLRDVGDVVYYTFHRNGAVDCVASQRDPQFMSGSASGSFIAGSGSSSSHGGGGAGSNSAHLQAPAPGSGSGSGLQRLGNSNNSVFADVEQHNVAAAGAAAGSAATATSAATGACNDDAEDEIAVMAALRDVEDEGDSAPKR